MGLGGEVRGLEVARVRCHSLRLQLLQLPCLCNGPSGEAGAQQWGHWDSPAPGPSYHCGNPLPCTPADTSTLRFQFASGHPSTSPQRSPEPVVLSKTGLGGQGSTVQLSTRSGIHAHKSHRSRPQWSFLGQCHACSCLSSPFCTHRLIHVLAGGGACETI